MICAVPGSERPDPRQPSHHLLKDAFNEARKHVATVLAPLNKKDHGDALNRWMRFLEYNVQTILLKVPSGSSAYKMFETLNDRGLKTFEAALSKTIWLTKLGVACQKRDKNGRECVVI
jgi:hypothetical protein